MGEVFGFMIAYLEVNAWTQQGGSNRKLEKTT